MNKKNSIRHKIVTSKYFELSGLLLLIILYSCIVQTKSGNFLTIGNIHNVLKEIVVYGILSCALAFPLINGTFDLSIESIAGRYLLRTSCKGWIVWSENKSSSSNSYFCDHLLCGGCSKRTFGSIYIH